MENNLNTQIFNDRINIIDDPLLPRGIESGPFDGEGITSRKNTLVKNVVLQNWILGLYSAKELKLKATGKALVWLIPQLFLQLATFILKKAYII